MATTFVDEFTSRGAPVRHKFIGETEGVARLPLPARLRLILALALLSWGLVGFLGYAVVTLLGF